MSYFGRFQSFSDLSEFGNNLSLPMPEEILFASYDGGSYDGEAIVLFEQNGKLFEVRAGHCSCNGLEDQWTPEETTWETLFRRIEEAGEYFLTDHQPEAKEELFKLISSHGNFNRFPKTEVEEEF